MKIEEVDIEPRDGHNTTDEGKGVAWGRLWVHSQRVDGIQNNKREARTPEENWVQRMAGCLKPCF